MSAHKSRPSANYRSRVVDSLARSILETIVDKGADLAKDLIVDGVELALERLKEGVAGDRASDRAILDWLREVQSGRDSL